MAWHGGRSTEKEGENVWNWKVFQLKTMRVLRRWISCTTHTIAIINGTRGTAAAAAASRREEKDATCRGRFRKMQKRVSSFLIAKRNAILIKRKEEGRTEPTGFMPLLFCVDLVAWRHRNRGLLVGLHPWSLRICCSV